MKVVFDVDDVLLNCNVVLERKLKERNALYSLEKLKTYDFNKSLTDEQKTSLGIDLSDKTNGLHVERGYIMDMLTSVDLFREERPIGDVFKKLSKLSKKCDLVLHTSANCVDVALFKVRQLNSIVQENDIECALTFTLVNDVHKESKCLAQQGLRTVTFTREWGSKSCIECDVVVEDCLENISMYSSSETLKLLVDMPYNQEQYNSEYASLFEDKSVKRVSSVIQAIELIYAMLTDV